MARATASQTPDAAASSTPDPIIIDLGRHKRKRIRRLRKGRGPLMARVMDTHAHLASTGVCDESAQPIVIVVREKKRRRGWW